ncbi:MAG TPA: NAD(P)H-hydrate dehydratase [Candidatus Angelobacter sp.]|nr:NAD(P)H-hydrate dehydratase [Candidatus Angelobacter sp.]
MKIVTAEEMREIDRLTTEKYGVPSLTLMENAGTAVAEFAEKHFEFSSVCVVCGKGNNGGDGFVAARKLKEAGKKVSVIILAKSPAELRGDAAKMFKKLTTKPFWIGVSKDFAKAGLKQALQAELILDAILGTGFKPPLKGLAADAVTIINRLKGWILSVDIPSGADADLENPVEERELVVRADAVVSFTAPKPALVFANLSEGPIAVAPIGSPGKLIAEHGHLHEDVLTTGDFQLFSARRKADANKGDFGHVLVVGGSAGKSGSVAMAGLSALRAGAGLVTVGCPKSVQPIVAASAPELMTVPLEETSEGTISLLALASREQWLAGKTAVVVGPGISRNPETAEFVRDLVGVCSENLVLDADGLNAFEGQAEELRPDSETPPFVLRALTPHPGEMSRLAGIPTGQVQNNRVAVALKTAQETRACVVLKGHRTLIASPDGHVWINTTGNPGMAKGGSGDVLSGIVAALLAQWQSGMVFRNPGWDESTGFATPEAESLVRLVSTQDPQARELRALAAEYRKTHDPKILRKLQAMTESKLFQSLTLLNCLAVCYAVYLHGLAGDIARDRYGERSMIATDIIQCLGEAFALCEEESFSKFTYLQR